MIKQGIKIGLIGGIIVLFLSLIGIVETFSERDIIYNVVSMGHTLLLLAAVFMAYLAAKRSAPGKPFMALVNSLISGLLTGSFLVLLIQVGKIVNLRSILINASPFLYEFLTFKQGLQSGSLLLLITGTLCGLFAGLLYISPSLLRRVLITSFTCIVGAGMLQDMLRPTFAAWGPLSIINDWLFTANGLTIYGALGLFILITVGMWLWALKGGTVKTGVQGLPPTGRQALKIGSFCLLFILLLLLPHILGLFLSEVLTIVGLFVLLGLGLNIVIGYAGLFDLGYVAFFAIGAYTTALLTSPESSLISATGFSFWGALPFVIGMGLMAGVILGVPVLKMRGDYLAIATLGFGEIIRLLVLSDFLRPWLGGAQGLAKIPKAIVPFLGIELGTPQKLYYLIFAGCLLVIYISWRLRDSRLGRAWKAMREDEDVAQAMGINLVATKLLAFATGAGFSALSGAIFASKLSSVYPHSFSVMISINVVCVIIVGGMGSIPGVIMGAIALVGLPELLREFTEYRLLVYGAALVAMMLLKPEGLWPEAVRRRELHDVESIEGENSESVQSPASKG